MIDKLRKFFQQRAQTLAWGNARLLLGIFFVVVLTPIGIILRFFRMNDKNQGIDSKAMTYWQTVDNKTSQPSCNERQY